MTGLERWAADNHTTAQEIQLIAMSESPSGWSAILGESFSGPEPFPAGRGTAIQGMLERGRSGGIPISAAETASLMGCLPDQVQAAAHYLAKAVPDAFPAPDTKVGAGSFDSACLPGMLPLLESIRGIEDEEEADARLQEGAASVAGRMREEREAAAKAAPKAKKPSRKGKYSISKTALAAMLSPDGGAMPIRDVRTFLLSVPGTKPADIAVMSDQEALDLFSGEYASVRLGDGTVIMPKADRDRLMSFIGSLGTYYIPPAEKPAEDAD